MLGFAVEYLSFEARHGYSDSTNRCGVIGSEPSSPISNSNLFTLARTRFFFSKHGSLVFDAPNFTLLSQS